MTRGWSLVVCLTSLLSPLAPLRADEAPPRDRVLDGLRRATDFFRKEVATGGGYLWRYSEDLSRREGERPATETMVWVQPPGTPSVGLAYLSAFEATGDPSYREAARDVAMALVNGQLRSGGWDYLIEFDPGRRARYAYRVEAGSEGKQNVSTLDDNTTQEALRLLMRVDRALDFRDRAIHEAVEYALSRLIEAQYPNGAWAQRFDRPPDPDKFPAKEASYPTTWPREYPGADYRGFYTLNDNALADTIDVLVEASRVYGEAKYRTAAQKGGGFLLLARMPEPQPAWAQQYDVEMHPTWARKFEPPAITGGESQGALRTLLKLYRETGDGKFLEPVPRALDYLRRSRLPDGRLARFYELGTNRPLYFTTDYKLTDSDADMPTHYSFKVGDATAGIAEEYERLRSGAGAKRPEPEARPRATPGLERRVEAVLAALDGRGRWVEEGRLRSLPPDDPTRRVIDCRTFIRNVQVLSDYLEATRP